MATPTETAQRVILTLKAPQSSLGCGIHAHVGNDSKVDEYSGALLAAAEKVTEAWLMRCVVTTAVGSSRQSIVELDVAAREMAAVAGPATMAALALLLDTDPDRQRTNPLSIFRAAIRYPTEVLVRMGVPTSFRPSFEARVLPDDIYGLSPATWADIDETLVEPGLIWGAWKAKTILDRRRADGQR
jgi:hypothetical protein